MLSRLWKNVSKSRIPLRQYDIDIAKINLNARRRAINLWQPERMRHDINRPGDLCSCNARHQRTSHHSEPHQPSFLGPLFSQTATTVPIHQAGEYSLRELQRTETPSGTRQQNIIPAPSMQQSMNNPLHVTTPSARQHSPWRSSLLREYQPGIPSESRRYRATNSFSGPARRTIPLPELSPLHLTGPTIAPHESLAGGSDTTLGLSVLAEDLLNFAVIERPVNQPSLLFS
jgi:hypothetical protein